MNWSSSIIYLSVIFYVVIYSIKKWSRIVIKYIKYIWSRFDKRMKNAINIMLSLIFCCCGPICLSMLYRCCKSTIPYRVWGCLSRCQRIFLHFCILSLRRPIHLIRIHRHMRNRSWIWMHRVHASQIISSLLPSISCHFCILFELSQQSYHRPKIHLSCYSRCNICLFSIFCHFCICQRTYPLLLRSSFHFHGVYHSPNLLCRYLHLRRCINPPRWIYYFWTPQCIFVVRREFHMFFDQL